MAKLPNFVEKERSLFQVLKFVFVESIRGSKRYSIMRYVAAAATAASAFIEFGAIAIIVNEFATHGVEGVRIGVIIGGLVLFAIADFFPAVIESFHNYAWEIQADSISRHLKSLMFKRIDDLDIGTIEQPEFQDLNEHANGRAWQSFYAVINLGTGSIRHIVSLVIAIVALIIISPWALVVIFVGSLPTYFLERKHSRLTAAVWKDGAEERRVWAIKSSAIAEKNSIVELKNFILVNVFKKKFLEVISGFHSRLKHLHKNGFRHEVISRLVLTTAFMGAFGLLVYGVYTGAIIVGSLVFSFGVLSRFQSAINQLFESFGRLSEHKAHLNRLIDFLEMKSVIVNGSIELDPTQPIHIQLKKVSFAYPGSDRRVLNNISLSFSTGDNIAIVGLNGAGKTTLIKLLTRVYDPSSGEILVNGIPLREYDLKSWKKCLGILLQEYSMYSEESIAENIMLGDVSKHDQELVQQAAQETTAHDFITELPEQYNQRVGTEFRGGVELSKGQKQKVALARVLYRDAPIVILDEPTASVDALSEDAIFKNLKQKHADQARIIISHKFSNVRDADQIILIQDGTILEQGSHDELMQKPRGKYRELFELQAEGYR